MEQRRYLSSRDAADYLGISVDSLHRLTSNRDIPFIKVNAHRLSFDRLDLDAWMRSRRVEAR